MTPGRVVVLTGAGISAESGLPTFRDADGLWEGHDPMVVATPEAYAADPDLVHRFYDERRAALARVDPNPAHVALARLEDALGATCWWSPRTSTTSTSGPGRATSSTCTAGSARRGAPPATRGTRGPGRSATGRRARRAAGRTLRPDVVWFGEIPHGMDDIEQALWAADLFVSIGTSGLVYPAAAFVQYAAARGTPTLELNLDASDSSSDFDESRRGPASVLVPAWVEELIG